MQDMRHPHVILFMGVVLDPPAIVTGEHRGSRAWHHARAGRGVERPRACLCRRQRVLAMQRRMLLRILGNAHFYKATKLPLSPGLQSNAGGAASGTCFGRPAAMQHWQPN